jgi:hypothetical protein
MMLFKVLRLLVRDLIRDECWIESKCVILYIFTLNPTFILIQYIYIYNQINF